MSAITYRAFSRTTNKIMISFAKSMTADYQKGELLNKSTGGMSFITKCELKPGSDILIKIPMSSDPNGATPHPDYLAEVRWCVKEEDQNATNYRIGVSLFSSRCVLCEKEIHHHNTDSIDLCEDCRGRFCSMSKGKMKTCVEKYLLGNVI
jgi:hypothetical protein